MFFYFVVQACTEHAEDTKLSAGLEPDPAAACSAVPPIQRKIPQRHADKFSQHAARTLTGVTTLYTVHVDHKVLTYLEYIAVSGVFFLLEDITSVSCILVKIATVYCI